jgi:hypothetical protein
MGSLGSREPKDVPNQYRLGLRHAGLLAIIYHAVYIWYWYTGGIKITSTHNI